MGYRTPDLLQVFYGMQSRRSTTELYPQKLSISTLYDYIIQSNNPLTIFRLGERLYFPHRLKSTGSVPEH